MPEVYTQPVPEAARHRSLFVVGIGASAGGLEALVELLGALPATGMGFIVVQHLDPTHESLLPEILAKKTTMAVSLAIAGEAVKPDHVYVIPPDAKDGRDRAGSSSSSAVFSGAAPPDRAQWLWGHGHPRRVPRRRFRCVSGQARRSHGVGATTRRRPRGFCCVAALTGATAPAHYKSHTTLNACARGTHAACLGCARRRSRAPLIVTSWKSDSDRRCAALPSAPRRCR